MCVTFVHDNLWRKILWSATHGPGFVINSFGKSKVCDANVASMIDEHVLWFQISKHDVKIMQVIKGKDSLSCKGENQKSATVENTCEELGLLLCESSSLLLLDDSEHLSTVDEFQDEIQIANILEVVVESHNESAINAEKDVLFVDCVFNLCLLEKKSRIGSPVEFLSLSPWR